MKVKKATTLSISIMNKTYCDFHVQGKKKLHERAALNLMVDRYSDPAPSILMADCGYESFNTFAHLIRKNMKFVIRMKDIDSNGILSSYDLPDDESDVPQRKQLEIQIFIRSSSLPRILTFWMKNAGIMISVSALSASGLKMEAIFVLQQISQKRNFPLRI